MLAATMNYRNLFDPMDLRRIIPSDITASAIAHLSLLTLFLLFSDVHPFGVVTAEQIPVEIVTPQEIAEKEVPAEPPVVEKTPEPVPAPTPQPDFPTPDKPAAASAPQPSAPPPAAAPAQKQAALAAPPAVQPQAVAPPQPQQTAAPAYKPPEPDLSVKYQVLLGLPPELPPPQARDKAGDNFDAPATEAAGIAKSLVGEFRRHLKTCLKLPASLASGDDVKVKLRVLMTPEGRLAADPVLIEASASMKGPLLMQGAISALQACQPYAMLPVDRYGEWKVLDLSFTPRDF
jgi:outer membrane biosynthesis protein TonB